MTRTAMFRLIAASAIGLVPFCNMAWAGTKAEAQIRAAAAWAAPLLAERCNVSRLQEGDLAGSGYFEISYRYKGQDQDAPDTVYPLLQLSCSAGGDNTAFVYLTRDPENENFRLLAFAEPKLDYDYTDESFTRLKAPPRIVGYRARTDLLNARFDPAARTLSMHARWPGRNGAWSSGVWHFVEGEFLLERYTVDPTYQLDSTPADTAASEASGSYQVYPQ